MDKMNRVRFKRGIDNNPCIHDHTSSSIGISDIRGTIRRHASTPTRTNPSKLQYDGCGGFKSLVKRYFALEFLTLNTKISLVRDTVHVIDGLLHHETDLTIVEHYTDTAGYTDQVFGLTHLLGFRFAPRLRDLADSKMYTIGKLGDFPKLEKLLGGQINTKIIQENCDDVLRLAHSIREGTASVSLIMGKSACKTKQFGYRTAGNGANRENDLHPGLPFKRGAAAKDPSRVGQREAMNALARAIFFGQTW